MPKPLVIVESPAKAKTIEGFLGRDRVTVLASFGHIRDLPSSAKEVPKNVTDPEVRRLGIDVNDHFAPIYVVPDNKKDRVRDLKAALKDASEVYLATDEDREGEAISWHVLEVLKPTVPVKRMVFHEITSEAIEEAIENSRDLDMKLVEAQEGRRILDRLFGYEMSVVTRRRAGGATSAGRVQSVAARLVVERERARMAFRAASYWDLEGTFAAAAHDASDAPSSPARSSRSTASGSPRAATSTRSPAGSPVPTRSRTSTKPAHARSRPGSTTRATQVASVESRAVVERPKPPFITSTLQQEAARKLGFSAGAHDGVAQRPLRERAHHLHAHRLDEPLVAGGHRGPQPDPQPVRRRVPPRRAARVPQQGEERAGGARGDPARGRPHAPADEMHGELHSSDERRLYDLIWKRTVACQMADARIRRVTVRLEATSTAGEAATFQATGRTIEFPGYLRAYVEGADDPDAELEDREAILPPLDEGDALACRELQPSGHTTQPPARYTEASLVKELEERGIGRPSTYASVIETLLRRDYVWKKGNALVPTWTAFAKVQLLERHFAHLIDYEFTATMEEALDAIARGEGEAEKWLHSFYFGNGTAGLRELVDEEHLATIDPALVNAVPIGHRRARPRDRRAGLAQRRQPRARRRQGAGARRPRARRAHGRARRGAARAGRGRARGSSAPIPRRASRCSCSRAASARSCSSASSIRSRRARGQKEKPKRASLFAT